MTPAGRIGVTTPADDIIGMTPAGRIAAVISPGRTGGGRTALCWPGQDGVCAGLGSGDAFP
jgi:hypothetical protein